MEGKTEKGVAHALDSSTDRTEDNGKIQGAGLGPFVGYLSSESDFFLLIQLFQFLKGGRVLGDDSTLFEQVRDIGHFSLPCKLVNISQELSSRDPSQRVFDPTDKQKGKQGT